MTNPDIAAQARRIASERVPPTTHPTPDWELARRHAERELRHRPRLWRLIALSIALAIFCWGAAALAWEAFWR